MRTTQFPTSGWATSPIVAYTLAGLGLGLCFPLAAWLLDLLTSGAPWSVTVVWLRHLANPVLWIVDTASLVLGLLGYQIGRQQRQVQRASAEARNQGVLRHAAEALRLS